MDVQVNGRIARLAWFDVADRWVAIIPATLARIGFGLICTGAFILTRLFVDLFAPTAGPFALIYPATLIATLFGSWRAGLTTYATSLLWTWYLVRPQAIVLHLVRPSDGPRTIVNAISAMVVLLLAELFRSAVRRAAVQRDAAIAALQAREEALEELNRDLEREVAERTREQQRTWLVSPDLLGVLTMEGFFERTNPAWQATLGWSAETLRTTSFIEFVHPDDVDRTHAAWEEVNAGTPILRFENRYRQPDGAWRWLSWVVVPEGGKFYCSARDVTAEKEGQADLAMAEEALRQSQKLEAIGQLTGGVAHDFNNLLTVIRGSVELLRRADLPEEKRVRYIDAISDTSDRAARLTGQLLAFARRQALMPEVFDAGASLLEVASMVRTLTGSRVMLETRVPPDACLIRADRGQFDTAIVNMAINARDAMEGEGRLTIAAAPASGIPAVRSHPPVAGDFVAVTIGDTGGGIDPANLDRIFEPFFTTKPLGEGTGLGLSQVIGFAKQSNGDIQIESVVGEGTILTLYLPRVRADAAVVVESAPDEPTISGEGFRVLIVEDNAQVGEFATSALRELGYDSVLALDAAAALAELARDRSRFQVVFSDVVMPGMSGLELGREIRRAYPDLPVILTSGYSHVLADNGDHGFELLHKPYSVEQLSRVLRKAIAWHARERAVARG